MIGIFPFNNCIFNPQQKRIDMKKLLIVSIAVMFLAISANGQFFQFGVKAGINYSSLSMDDITGITEGGVDDVIYDLTQGDRVRGYQAGLMARIKIAMVFVQPEAYFNVTGGSVKQVFESGDVTTLDVQFNRVDIPLLVGVKFGPARINAGPVGSAMVSSVNDLSAISPELATLSSNFTWGFQAGVGLDLFRKLAVDLRYEGSLSKYGDSFTVGGTPYNFDARPRQWIIGLGYWF